VKNLEPIGVPLLPDVGGKWDLGWKYFEDFDVLMTRRVLHPFATVFYADPNLGVRVKT